MVDGAPTSDPSNEPTQHEDLPDRLRVHQLARSLGNTNKEVLDALFQLDGQARNVHSGVDREDALRVRDMLFAKTPAVFPSFISAAVTAAWEAEAADAPESRPTETATERPALHAAVRFSATATGRTRTPKTMPTTTSTSRMPRTTTKSRPIGRPTAGGVVAVGVAAGDVANRPDPTAPTPTRRNGRPRTRPNPRTPTSQTRPIPTTAIRRQGFRRRRRERLGGGR